MKLKLVENINLSEFFAGSITNWANAKVAMAAIKSSIEQAGYRCEVKGTEAVYILPKTDYLVNLKVDISDGVKCKITFTNYIGKTLSREYDLTDGKLNSTALSEIIKNINDNIQKVTGGAITEGIFDNIKNWVANKIVTHNTNKENKNAVSVVSDQITNAIKNDLKGLKGDVKSDKTSKVFEINVVRESGKTFILAIFLGKSVNGDKLLVNQIIGCRENDKSETNLANDRSDRYDTLDKVLKLIGKPENLGVNFKLDDATSRRTNSNDDEIAANNGSSGDVRSRLRADLRDTSLGDLFENLNVSINEAWDESVAESKLKDSSVDINDKVNILRLAIFKKLGKDGESFDPETKITKDAAKTLLNVTEGNLNVDRTPLLKYVINYLTKDFDNNRVTSKYIEILNDDSIKPILQKYYKTDSEFIYDNDFWKGDDWDKIKTLLRLIDQIKNKDFNGTKVIDLDQLKTYITLDTDTIDGDGKITKSDDFKSKVIALKDVDQIEKVLDLIEGGKGIKSSSSSSSSGKEYGTLYEYLKDNKDIGYTIDKVKELLKKAYPSSGTEVDALKEIVLNTLKLIDSSTADDKLKTLLGDAGAAALKY